VSQAGRNLLILALLLGFVGLLAVVAGSQASQAAPLLDDLGAVTRGAFGDGAWAALWRLSLALLVCAVTVNLVERFIPRASATRSQSFSAIDGTTVREAVQEVARRVESCLARPKPDIIATFNEVMRGAMRVAASDVHVTPAPETFRVVYRVQGTLHEVAILPKEHLPALATRVKVLARLDTYIRETPQDGRLVMEFDSGALEARVSTLPTETGERIVIRLLRGGRSVSDLAGLTFGEDVERGIAELLRRPQGLIFVTGPVGSGKTTTLYAAMKHIAETRGKTTSLVTLEDPIELELPFASQTQMHKRKGVTFASVLRSVLRQDPNVLMVGEIRDRETAEITVQAGLTGHLILTTVHANSAVGAFARLLDIQVEPFAVASASIGALSQRLVRTLCTACRVETPANQREIETFARNGVTLPSQPFFTAPGCDFCEGQGYTGRLPIAELLIIDSEIEHAITERRTTTEIQELALARGMKPLLADGLRRALLGETSLAEVLRVAE
jgi:general secretion pathway protein E